MAERSVATTIKIFQSFRTAPLLASTLGAVSTEVIFALDVRSGYTIARRYDAVQCPNNPTAIS
jgi:hypothetical protein